MNIQTTLFQMRDLVINKLFFSFATVYYALDAKLLSNRELTSQHPCIPPLRLCYHFTAFSVGLSIWVPLPFIPFVANWNHDYCHHQPSEPASLQSVLYKWHFMKNWPGSKACIIFIALFYFFSLPACLICSPSLSFPDLFSSPFPILLILSLFLHSSNLSFFF